MDAPWVREVESWTAFYTYIGTAAATLMGLVFVVVSLGRGLVGSDRAVRAVRAFYTPIIVFFSTVIIASTVMLLPHITPKPLGVLLGGLGVVGLIYMVISGALHQWRTNELSFDDLLFYIVLPVLAYIALCAAALSLWSEAPAALSMSAGAMILLLIIGIRNSWDLVLSIARIDTTGSDPRDPPSAR
jgi:hypothetical protein